jgi:IS5 family transposase
VSEFEFPADLVDLKTAFLATEAEISAHSATLPSAGVIISGEAEITEEQHATSRALHHRAADLAAQLSQHPFLRALEGPDRLNAMERLTRVAREHLKGA